MQQGRVTPALLLGYQIFNWKIGLQSLIMDKSTILQTLMISYLPLCFSTTYHVQQSWSDNKESGEITSLGYPDGYPHNMDDSVVLQVRYVLVNVIKLSLRFTINPLTGSK